jgi:biopolymer transport protein ExbD
LIGEVSRGRVVVVGLDVVVVGLAVVVVAAPLVVVEVSVAAEQAATNTAITRRERRI